MNAHTDAVTLVPSLTTGKPPSARSRAARLLIELLAGLEGGSLALRLPDGHLHLLGNGPQRATLNVHDEAVFGRILARGSIGFAEAYMDGQWDSEDLQALLVLLANNRVRLEDLIHGSALRLLPHWIWHRLRANTRGGSRRNIEAHYDLGNEFYRLWLDETMSYSSALWAERGASLEEAQREKYRHALRALGLQPGQHLLEIGCGWGGLAEVACSEFGARVSGVTLSHEQLAWARERAARGAFDDRAEFFLRDYRDLRGQYDHIVSIEMIEAVGEAYWPSYFAQLRELLRPGGRAVVQAITITDELFPHYRKDVDFIQRYIFPGGMLPSPSIMAEQGRRAGLELLEAHCFGQDYARTLALWLQRFDASLDAVRAQGFDERFVRMWRFYLVYCEAGFRSGSTDVGQYVLKHAGA